MLGLNAPWLTLLTSVSSLPSAPLYFLFHGDWPEERVAWSELVKRWAKLQLWIVLHVILDGAQAHSKHHEQNREQGLGDQALPVSAAVVEPLGQYGYHLLPGQGHTTYCGRTGKLYNTWEKEWRQDWIIFLQMHLLSCCLAALMVPAFPLEGTLSWTFTGRLYHRRWSAFHQDVCSNCRNCWTRLAD